MLFSYDPHAPTGRDWTEIENRRKNIPFEQGRILFEFRNEFQDTTFGAIRFTGSTYIIVVNRKYYFCSPGASTWQILKGNSPLMKMKRMLEAVVNHL